MQLDTKVLGLLSDTPKVEESERQVSSESTDKLGEPKRQIFNKMMGRELNKIVQAKRL